MDIKRGRRGATPKLQLRSVVIPRGLLANPENRLAKAFKWVAGRLEGLLQKQHGSEAFFQVLDTLRSNPPPFVGEEQEAVGARLRILRIMGIDGLATGLPGGEELAQDFKDEHEPMTTRLEQLVHEAQGAQRKAWTEWAARAMDQGAGRAHRFTKEPKPWKPTTVLVEGGRVSSDPQLPLAGLGIQWAEIWRAETVKEGDPVGEDLLVSEHCGRGPPLDRASPAEPRALSRAYKAKSATSLDGFHMRHYSMLCDDALVALGILFQCMESHGYLPSQLHNAVVAQL